MDTFVALLLTFQEVLNVGEDQVTDIEAWEEPCAETLVDFIATFCQMVVLFFALFCSLFWLQYGLGTWELEWELD